jgi:hypothetical protein
VESHESARKHGISEADILHAITQAIQVFDLDPDADPPKVLAIGPDNTGNLLEVIWLDLDDDRDLVIHAMPLRPSFFSLLADEEPRR